MLINTYDTDEYIVISKSRKLFINKCDRESYGYTVTCDDDYVKFDVQIKKGDMCIIEKDITDIHICHYDNTITLYSESYPDSASTSIHIDKAKYIVILDVDIAYDEMVVVIELQEKTIN